MNNLDQDTILSETANPDSAFSRRQRLLSAVSGGTIGVIAAQGAVASVVLTTGLPTSLPILVGAVATAGLAGVTTGQGLVRVLSIPERRQIIAGEELMAERDGKRLLLSPEAEGKLERSLRAVENVATTGLAVAGGVLMATLTFSPVAPVNPIAATIATVGMTWGGYYAGRVVGNVVRVGATIAANVRNMIREGDFLPGGDHTTASLGSEPSPEPENDRERQAEFLHRLETDIRLAQGEGLDLSDMIRQRRNDPNITEDVIRAAAHRAVQEANEAALRVVNIGNDLQRVSMWESLSDAQRAEVESRLDYPDWPDLDAYLRDVEMMLTESRVVQEALSLPRHESAASAIAASANPDARVFAARERDGLTDADPVVVEFVAAPAWVTPDGRIVRPNRLEGAGPPDLFAVQAISRHDAVATTPATVEFYETEAAAAAAAERLTASLPPEGLIFPKDAMTDEQNASELSDILDANDASELLERIRARIAEIAETPELLRPATHVLNIDAVEENLMAETQNNVVPEIEMLMNPEIGHPLEPSEDEFRFSLPLSSGLYATGREITEEQVRQHPDTPAWVKIWEGGFSLSVTNEAALDAHLAAAARPVASSQIDITDNNEVMATIKIVETEYHDPWPESDYDDGFLETLNTVESKIPARHLLPLLDRDWRGHDANFVLQENFYGKDRNLLALVLEHDPAGAKVISGAEAEANLEVTVIVTPELENYLDAANAARSRHDANLADDPRPVSSSRSLWTDQPGLTDKMMIAQIWIEAALERGDTDVALNDENGTEIVSASHIGPIMEQIDIEDRVRLSIAAPGEAGQPETTSIIIDWTKPGAEFIATDAEPSHLLDDVIKRAYVLAEEVNAHVPEWKARRIAEASENQPDAPEIEAHFKPEVWVNDYAIEADAEGPQDFRVPLSSKLFMPDEQGNFPDDDSYGTDELRATQQAPGWVQEWRGPYSCEVTNRDVIEAYFQAELFKIAEIEATARQEVNEAAQPARKLLAEMGSPEWPSVEAEGAAMQLATILTDRYFYEIDGMAYTDAERDAIASVIARMDAHEAQPGENGYRLETFFYARANDGALGYLFEFEFDDDQTPTDEMVANFKDKVTRLTVSEQIEDAKIAYIEPGGDEIFNGRAAFQVFIPDDRESFPARLLDRIALYTASEHYRYPDPEAWLDIYSDFAHEDARQLTAQSGPFMEHALAALAAETYGIADEWSDVNKLREIADQYQKTPGHDPDEASLLLMRAAMQNPDLLYGDEHGAMEKWRNTVMMLAKTHDLDLHKDDVRFNPVGGGAAHYDADEEQPRSVNHALVRMVEGPHVEIARRAVGTALDAILPAEKLAERGFRRSASLPAFGLDEPGTDRIALVWPVENGAGGVVWVEGSDNVPAGGKVTLEGNPSYIIGNARVEGESTLKGATISGGSRISDSMIVNMRVIDCEVGQSKVANTTSRDTTMTRALVQNSDLTNCVTPPDPVRSSRIENVIAHNTTFYGGAVPAGERYDNEFVVGADRAFGPSAAFRMPRNDKFEPTGRYRSEQYEGEDRVLFQVAALRDIYPFNDQRVEAGTAGGWIEKAENLMIGGKADDWTRSEAWVGADALVMGDSSIRENASVRGASPEQPAIIADSTIAGQARVVGAVVEESTVKGVTHIEPGWHVMKSSINDASLRDTDSGLVRHSTLDNVGTHGVVSVTGSQISRAVLGFAGASSVVAIHASKGKDFSIFGGQLSRVEIGSVRFEGRAKELADGHLGQSLTILSDVNLSKVRIAPGSSLRGLSDQTLTLPEGTMFAGKIDRASDATPRMIAAPISPNLMFTGDWGIVDVPLHEGQKEYVFEITALRDLPARQREQVQLDGQGHARGTIPAVKAGDIGGHIGPGVVMSGPSAWIESGGVATGLAQIHDRAFINRNSHVHDAALHGNTVVIDSIVSDSDTQLGLSKQEVAEEKARRQKHLYAGGQQRPLLPQSPVVIGAILRHSTILDAASVIATITSNGREWDVMNRPVVENLTAIRTMNKLADGPYKEGKEMPNGHSPSSYVPGEKLAPTGAAQRAFQQIMRKTVSLVKHRDGAVQNVATVRALPEIHSKITRKGEAEAHLSSVAENGKIGVVRAGMDCDGVQYHEERIIDYPKSLIRFLEAEDKHESYLDGPERVSFVRPGGVKHGYYASADRNAEAFENGHSHVIHTGPLPTSRDREDREQTVSLRDIGDIDNDRLRKVIEAAITYEAARPEKPITTYMAHLGVKPDADGGLPDSDLLSCENNDPKWAGLRETLRHMGGTVTFEGDHATYEYDPVQEYAERVSDAERVLRETDVSVAGYRVVASDATALGGQVWEGHLDPRGGAEDRLSVAMHFLASGHDAPTMKPEAAPGDFPALHSAERIDGGRVMVRFQALPDPDDQPRFPAFQTAIVPEGARIEPSALRWPITNSAIADSVAREIADRDPEFYTRKDEYEADAARPAPTSTPAGPPRGGPGLG